RMPNGIQFKLFPRLASRIGLALTVLVLYSIALAGQTTTTSITDGTTVPLVAPGAPSGSYALSGFDTVNLFNGNLDVRVPLLRVGGRGEAGYTMVLPVERSWRIETMID